MSAVWRAARAAVRRRKLQTAVIGIVVLISTATLIVALGLLAAASAPFDQAYAKQSGAHVVAAFDTTKASTAQVAATADRPGVTAAAGPFGEIVLDVPGTAQSGPQTLTTVGRADLGGPVDRLNLWSGQWATAPGQIVLAANPGTGPMNSLGTKFTAPGGQTLTVVGFAYSVSKSADAWVSPAQMAALKPTAAEMLYRFSPTAVGTDAELNADLSGVTAGLPADSLLGSQNYLALKDAADAGPGTFVPFLVAFGILGLLVAILIVAKVVSGAVIAGFRHIGVLKALGFTPGQVMAVYMVMVGLPAVVGCVLGTALGIKIADRILTNAFENFGAGPTGVSPLVVAAALLGMPALVLLAALIPALRARGLSAIAALTAGSAQRAGKGLAVQRRLAGSRLPRSVSLGLGLPFARPGRSLTTLAVIVLGVLTVTFATGLTLSVTAYEAAVQPSAPNLIGVLANVPGMFTEPGAPQPKLSDAQDEAMLRALPGVVHLDAVANQQVNVLGEPSNIDAMFSRGDQGEYTPTILAGHWPTGPGQVAANSRFLGQRGLALGDDITLALNGKQTRVQIVGKVETNFADGVFSDWQTLQLLAPNVRADSYDVELKPGTNVQSYITALQAADPGLRGLPSQGDQSGGAKITVATCALLALMLGSVSALGVFNSVVLNTRERRRDLGVLKSIGMTPRQVTAMLVTSMGVLGVLGGLIGAPLGWLVHRIVGPAMLRAAQAEVTGSVMNVLSPELLILTALAGVAIAVLGAYIPSRSAARLTIAQVLHSE